MDNNEAKNDLPVNLYSFNCSDEHKSKEKVNADKSRKRRWLYFYNSLVNLEDKNDFAKNYRFLNQIPYYRNRGEPSDISWLLAFFLNLILLWCVSSGSISWFGDVDVSWWEVILYASLFLIPFKLLFNVGVNYKNDAHEKFKNLNSVSIFKIFLYYISAIGIFYWLFSPLYFTCSIISIFLALVTFLFSLKKWRIKENSVNTLYEEIIKNEPLNDIKKSDLWEIISYTSGLGSIAYLLKNTERRNFTNGFSVFRKSFLEKPSDSFNRLVNEYKSSGREKLSSFIDRYLLEKENNTTSNPKWAYVVETAIAQLEKDFESFSLDCNYYRGSIVFIDDVGVREISDERLTKILTEVHILTFLNEIKLFYVLNDDIIIDEFKDAHQEQLNRLKNLLIDVINNK